MPDSPRLERLNRADWRLLGVCGAILVASLAFGLTYFDRAFPEASIDFKYDRSSSEALAIGLLESVGLSPAGLMPASRFDVDHPARIFLERSLGLERANALMGDEVEVWSWTHRWFRPLETEEYRVGISPRGEVVSFEHRIEESAPAPSIDPAMRVPIATRFLASIGIDTSELELVSVSEKTRPARVDSVLVWEHRSVRPAGAAYRYAVTLQGGRVGGFSQSLQVPEEWRREYASLRAKNETAGDVASVLLLVTTIAALFVFVIRLRRGDIQLKYSGWVGGACAVLLILVSLNSLPSALANYDTQTSLSSFLFQHVTFAVLGGVAFGLSLMVMVGAGDSLLRERLPDKLAMPLLFSRRAFRSKRVFTGNVIGFTLVGGFLAYQVAFYLIADHFGAWAPAEIPYDETLNTLLPWAVVLFGGFFPAFSEEYLSRAFSIPFLERLLKSRLAAIGISAFAWGFAHSAYPNQPFFIRGLEVGMAGVVLGFVVYHFGILPALVWHYTVDAIYTSLLMMQSGNTYYMVSSGICAFILAIPLLLSGLMYVLRGGFVPDEDLENRIIGTPAADAPAPVEEVVLLPPPPKRPTKVIAAGTLAAAVAFALFLLLPSKLTSIADYPMTPDEAIEEASAHLGFTSETRPEKVVVFPSAGFRSWEDGEKGGSPGVYDEVAADHIARGAEDPFVSLRWIMTGEVEGATWKVRFFTPGVTEEFMVEIDPRRGDVIGESHTIEESAPGAMLERDAAEEIALAALRQFDVDVSSIEMKEAVAIPMPDRRDWIFHFERKKPLAPDAWLRFDVRLGGNRVTHVGRTIRIPESVRREAGESRLVNSLLFVARIAGAIFILVIVGSSAVLSFREGHLRWKAALRAVALLAIPAAIAGVLQMSIAAHGYRTSISWDTFVGRQLLLTSEGVAFQLFMMFLSLVVLAACLPWTMDLLSRPGRQAFGRDAVIRALAAAATILGLFLAGDAIELASRVGLDIGSPVSDRSAIPFPALAVAWQAISTASWIAAVSVALSTFIEKLDSERRKRLTEAAMILAFTVFLMDSSARPADIPIVFLHSALAAVVMWLVAKHVFAPNPLAVPLTMLILMSSDDIASWFRSGRPDLVINAAVLGAFVLAAMAWALSGRETSDEGRGFSER